MTTVIGRLAALAAAALLSTSAVAQEAAQGLPVWEPIETPDQAGAIPLYPNGAPEMDGAQTAENWGVFDQHFRAVRNVTQPAITPYLPHPSRATGAAVLVAPGGGFNLLAWDHEGTLVASWLAERGVAAFVLKYRVRPTPTDADEIARADAQRPQRGPGDPPPPAFQPAVDDGVAAMRLIRSRAREWGIDPQRVGMIGFSAGARNTLSVTLAGAEGATPDFIGLVYGPVDTMEIEPGVPPLFAALAVDDPLFNRSDFGLIRAWRDAGSSVEFHLYNGGSHGFGMRPVGTTATLWPEQFLAWMDDRGFLAGEEN